MAPQARRTRTLAAIAPLVLALLVLGLAPLADVMPGRPSVQMAAASGPGTVQVLHLPSADTDRRTRDVWVYRPPGPDSANLPMHMSESVKIVR